MVTPKSTINVRFQVKQIEAARCNTSCAIVPIFEAGKLSTAAIAINRASSGLIDQMIKRKDIEGKAGQLLMLPQVPGVTAERVMLAGCGKAGGMTEKDFLTLVQKLSAHFKQHPVSDLAFFIDDISVVSQNKTWLAKYLAQGFQQLDYRFEQMKSRHKHSRIILKSFTFACSHKPQHAELQRGIDLGKAIANGMMLAKDLGNLPGNICTPAYLAQTAQALARQHPRLHCKILEEKQMRSLGMGAFLSVTAGTEQPAKIIILEYRGGAKSQAPHVLVGKGITFDSGGISLKPGAGMDEMKFDMCGAASVLGTLLTVSELSLPLNVIGIVAAAENMPGGRATKPGDIVTSMSGQTIEILNTDAEGRLVLCDALTYAERFKPKTVIDIATLTGACVVALGSHAHGLYSNNEELAQQLLQAGKVAQDKAWQMPLWEEYDKQLKSPFADMANIGGPNGGSVTAACFLARFAKQYTWAHLDIAGTAWNKGENKGSTARPLPLLVHYLLSQIPAPPAKNTSPDTGRRRTTRK
jgi:leucyl aminopeptidase